MNGLDFGTAIGLIKGLGSPDPAVIESAVSDWLDDHPEATTTVQDGSITKAKLDSNLQGTVDDVADLKSAYSNCEQPFDVIANSYVDIDGTIKPYPGWSRTGYIPCEQGETLRIYTSVASTYNVFYSSEGTPITGTPNFKLVIGWNDVYVPNGANYYILSNSNAGMSNTVIKLPFTVQIERNSERCELFSNQFNGSELEISPDFVYGSVNNSYVDTYTTKYYRSKMIPAYVSRVVIHLPSNMRVFWAEYKEDKTGNNIQENSIAPDSTGIASFVLKDDSKYFKVIVSKSSLANLVPSDLENVSVGYYSSLNERLDEVEASVQSVGMDSIEGISMHPYSAKLSQVVDNIQSTKPLVLLHFSDIHGYQPNLNRLIAWMAQLSPFQLDDVICTGDMVAGNFTHPDILNSTDGAEGFLQLIGNHDAYNTTSANIATGKQCYDKYLAPNISNWSVVQPTDAATDGLCYYYKDYATKNIRLICLDSIHVDSDQLTWLASVLSDAKTNNLSVVIASHYYSATGVQPIECSYSIRSAIAASDFETMPESVYDAVDSFINNNGEFICWIVGHSHFDYLGTPVNHPNQLLVFVESAGLPYAPSDDARIEGTASQDSFNVIGFDTANGLIKVVRIGNVVNKLMQSKAMLCYDYISKQLKSCQ